MCKDALVYSAFWQLLLLMHAPPKKAKQPSLNVTKTAQFTIKGVSGTTYVPLSDGSFPFLSFWFSSPTSDKPCFNLTKKIKISSRTEHLRESQEKVFSAWNLKGRRWRPRERREKSRKRISFPEFLQKNTASSSQVLISSLLVFMKRKGVSLYSLSHDQLK